MLPVRRLSQSLLPVFRRHLRRRNSLPFYPPRPQLLERLHPFHELFWVPLDHPPSPSELSRSQIESLGLEEPVRNVNVFDSAQLPGGTVGKPTIAPGSTKLDFTALGCDSNSLAGHATNTPPVQAPLDASLYTCEGASNNCGAIRFPWAKDTVTRQDETP